MGSDGYEKEANGLRARFNALPVRGKAVVGFVTALVVRPPPPLAPLQPKPGRRVCAASPTPTG